jgi:conjugative transfer signal peptidase TraF
MNTVTSFTSRAAAATLVMGFCAVCLYPYPRPLAPLLVYNASPSLPVGLYRSIPKGDLELGDIVRLALPESMQPVMARWGYAHHPAAQFLIKQIAGLPGQRVCRLGGRMLIDGGVLGPVHRMDHLGYALPQALPEGVCARLGPAAYFVATPNAASLDSRYFGPVSRQAILQVLQPLWVARSLEAAVSGSKWNVNAAAWMKRHWLPYQTLNGIR